MDLETLNLFLNNDNDTLQIPMQPLQDIIDIFENLGFEYLSDMYDINGWQCDFWMYFKKDNYPYQIMINGSLYYGNYKIYKEKHENSNS